MRMLPDSQAQHGSRWQAIVSIAAKIGCSANTLNDWVKRAEVDSGRRAGIPSDMASTLKALERENRELRQNEEDQKTVRRTAFPTNDILRKASAYFAPAERGRRSKGWSVSSTISVEHTGSTRSARHCRSPHPPIAPIRRSRQIRRFCRTVPSVMFGCGPRSSLSLQSAGRSLVCARSGGSFVVRGSAWRVARRRGR
jgi:transposase